MDTRYQPQITDPDQGYMTVYIQSLDGFPIADWGAIAMLGFRERGAKIRLYEQIEEVPLNRYSLIVGPIEDCNHWFEQMGIAIPAPMTMPPVIQGYAQRHIDLMSFAQAMQKTDFPFFVKPHSVIEGKLVGLYWYLGDFCVFPDTNVIKAAITDYISQPAAYSIDFGVTTDGRTVLVECNDFFALGNYGLNPKLYTRGIVTRWMQILRQA